MENDSEHVNIHRTIFFAYDYETVNEMKYVAVLGVNEEDGRGISLAADEDWYCSSLILEASICLLYHVREIDESNALLVGAHIKDEFEKVLLDLRRSRKRMNLQIMLNYNERRALNLEIF